MSPNASSKSRALGKSGRRGHAQGHRLHLVQRSSTLHRHPKMSKCRSLQMNGSGTLFGVVHELTEHSAYFNAEKRCERSTSCRQS